MHLMPLDLFSTLGDLAEKNRQEPVRYVLAARCEKCDYGRRLEAQTLVDLFGPTATLKRVEDESVCPGCALKGGQTLSVFVVG